MVALASTEILVFPGLGGDHRELAALSAGCAPILRCVTVEFPDWTEIFTKQIDLDGLIRYCVARVNELAPHGKLRLAGYSFGGTMAFAVAVALAESGREIARLGLLDSPATPFVATKPPSLRNRCRRFVRAVRQGELHAEIAGTLSGLAMRAGNTWMLLAIGRLRGYRLPFDLQEHLNKPITCRLREKLLLDLIDRMQTARPKLDVPAVLFRSSQQHVFDAAPDLGWSEHLASLEVVNLPGNHHTVIEPEHIGGLCKSFVDKMMVKTVAPVAGLSES